MGEQLIGKIIHYYTHLGVGVIEITNGELKVGDILHFKGHTSDFSQEVSSMQMEHKSVNCATVGEKVGLKTKEHVRQHDEVFKVVP